MDILLLELLQRLLGGVAELQSKKDIPASSPWGAPIGLVHLSSAVSMVTHQAVKLGTASCQSLGIHQARVTLKNCSRASVDAQNREDRRQWRQQWLFNLPMWKLPQRARAPRRNYLAEPSAPDMACLALKQPSKWEGASSQEHQAAGSLQEM